jgi:hypothetical protein
MASGSTLPSGKVKRRIPHFRYDRGSSNGLISLDHWGREHTADNRTGIIQRQIIEGLYEVENDGI